MNGRFPFCNGFVFKGKETILIDAGLGDELIQQVDQCLHIDTLVISHSHPDHIKSWHMLTDRTLFLPRETRDTVQDMETLGVQYTGDPGSGRQWVDHIGQPLGIVALREPDQRFGDGDVFDIGTARIQAIHTPGHYYDHYCFLDHVSGTLITTDIDFSSFGPWYGNPEGSIKAFKASVHKVMDLPCKRVCSSHRQPIEGDASMQFAAFLQAFERQKSEVLDCLGQGKTLDEIIAFSPFYGNKFMNLAIQNVFERQMVLENLALLMEEGIVCEDKGRFIPRK